MCEEKPLPTKQLEWLCVWGHRAESAVCMCVYVCARARERERNSSYRLVENPQWFNYTALYDLGGLLDRSISS